MTSISTYCQINNHTVRVNGLTVLTRQEKSEDDWARQIYKHFKIDYPKFYKMDVLSKFALLGSEILKTDYTVMKMYGDDEIALIFSNHNSSADVDIQFRDSYLQDEAPSPSLFVYTLPNILIGEIAIRNKWYGENLFFIRDKFDASCFTNFCEIQLKEKAKACLGGWVEVLNDNTDVFLFFVDTKENDWNRSLSIETLNNIYKS